MKPSNQVLEQNLRLLFKRCYQPVVPSAEFVRRLEGELAPWLEGQRSPASSARRALPTWPTWSYALAAAGLLLVFFLIKGSGPASSPRAEVLLERGEVAIREAGGAWRAPTQVEILDGIEWRGAELTIRTPLAQHRVVELTGGEAWSLEFEPRTQLFAWAAETGPSFHVERGSVVAHSGTDVTEFVAPQSFSWDGEGFQLSGEVAALGQQEPKSTREDVGQGVARVADAAPPASTSDPTGARIHGRALIAESGQLLEDFDVTLLRSESLPRISMPQTTHFSEAAGEFSLPNLKPGTYSFYLQSEGRAVWKQPDIDLSAGTDLELEVRVELGSNVRGFVVDQETGAAIAGALVIAESDAPMQVVSLDASEFPPEVRSFTFSASDGSFELEHLSSGPKRLRASGPDHAPSWTADMELVSGQGRDGLLIELTPGGGVSGLVQRANGEAWAGARLVVSRFDPTGGDTTMTYRGVWTDAEGHYSAENLAPGFYVVLLFGDVDDESEAENYAEPEYSSVQVREGRTERVDFTPGVGASVYGVVTDHAGEPRPGVNVQLLRDNSGFRADTSDEAGVFRIEVDTPGHYELFAGAAEASVRVASLRLRAGEEHELDFQLAGASLHVELSDAETGAAVQGAQLFLFPSKATTRTQLADYDELIAMAWRGSKDGYMLEDVPTGGYDLLVLTESGQHAMVLHEGIFLDAQGELVSVSVELPKAGSARLEVVDAAGLAVAGARVQFIHPFGRRWRFNHPTKTDAQGVLTVGGLLPGTWRGSVRGVGFEKARFELVVDEGVEASLRVQLRPR